MLKFISETMGKGEIAALYQEGPDAVIIINDRVRDPDTRTNAINRLLARATLPLAAGGLPLLLHLAQESSSTAGQGFLPFGI